MTSAFRDQMVSIDLLKKQKVRKKVSSEELHLGSGFQGLSHQTTELR